MPGLVAWDSVWFLKIAQCGYETEQSHAFLPLLPGEICLLLKQVSDFPLQETTVCGCSSAQTFQVLRCGSTKYSIGSAAGLQPDLLWMVQNTGVKGMAWWGIALSNVLFIASAAAFCQVCPRPHCLGLS